MIHDLRIFITLIWYLFLFPCLCLITMFRETLSLGTLKLSKTIISNPDSSTESKPMIQSLGVIKSLSKRTRECHSPMVIVPEVVGHGVMVSRLHSLLMRFKILLGTASPS